MANSLRRLQPNMNRASLDLKQVRMILRIYWTDHYTRAAQGKQATHGIRKRLARQFNTNIEIVKKIVSIKPNHPGGKRRRRYPTIALQSMQKQIKARLKREGITP